MKNTVRIVLCCTSLVLISWKLSAQDYKMLVFNETDLREIAKASTEGGQSYYRTLIALESDITIKGNHWRPIGIPAGNNESFPFQGEFDGQGHTITIETAFDVVYAPPVMECYSGLFGYIGEYGAVRNLKVQINNGSVSINDNGTQGSFGVIAGHNNGLIEGCSVEGNIRVYTSSNYCYYSFGCIAGCVCNGVIRDCNNNANITTTNISNVGGVAGRVDGSILNNNANTGAINAQRIVDHGSIGGIAGICEGHGLDDYSYIINCLNSGSVNAPLNTVAAGGVVGACETSIVFYSGNAGGIVSDADCSGGIIGAMSDSSVYGSFHSGKIRSQKRVSNSNAIIGYMENDDEEIVEGCYVLKLGGNQSPNKVGVKSSIVSQEQFIRKANAVYPRFKNKLLLTIKKAGYWDPKSSYFASNPWEDAPERLFPCFKR